MHSLTIVAQRADGVEHEDMWDKIENSILPLVESLPYHRGYDYRVIIGRIHGDYDFNAMIEVAFSSMDDLERASESEQLKEMIEKCQGVFKSESLQIYATHHL
ncbi:MAG: hypothetical protein GY855_02740 [candidate division Zixibacteria bacterium]|nr:hypothetical protein [candidate division Zixibacteria bacterium]